MVHQVCSEGPPVEHLVSPWSAWGQPLSEATLYPGGHEQVNLMTVPTQTPPPPHRGPAQGCPFRSSILLVRAQPLLFLPTQGEELQEEQGRTPGLRRLVTPGGAAQEQSPGDACWDSGCCWDGGCWWDGSLFHAAPAPRPTRLDTCRRSARWRGRGAFPSGPRGGGRGFLPPLSRPARGRLRWGPMTSSPDGGEPGGPPCPGPEDAGRLSLSLPAACRPLPAAISPFSAEPRFRNATAVRG